MSILLPSNARGPILDLALPAVEDAAAIVLRNKTTGKHLTINLPAKWSGADLSLDFFRRTISDQSGLDRSSLLDAVDSQLWTPEPLIAGANDVEVEVLSQAVGSQTRSPGTVEDIAGEGSAWSSPGNAKASDNARATAEILEAGTLTHYLAASNYGFTIPTVATIVGIRPAVERLRSGAGCKDNSIRLLKAGVISGSDLPLPGTWGTSDAEVLYGVTKENLWGLTLKPTDVNASGFGFAIKASKTEVGTSKPAIDHMPMTVYYRGGLAYNATATLRWEKGYF